MEDINFDTLFYLDRYDWQQREFARLIHANTKLYNLQQQKKTRHRTSKRRHTNANASATTSSCSSTADTATTPVTPHNTAR